MVGFFTRNTGNARPDTNMDIIALFIPGKDAVKKPFRKHDE
jgi:hypothetical protein